MLPISYALSPLSFLNGFQKEEGSNNIELPPFPRTHLPVHLISSITAKDSVGAARAALLHSPPCSPHHLPPSPPPPPHSHLYPSLWGPSQQQVMSLILKMSNPWNLILLVSHPTSLLSKQTPHKSCVPPLGSLSRFFTLSLCPP